jgi:hypothetical protein
MTRSAVGETNTIEQRNDSSSLSHDWYRDLSPVQLTAYVRFQFIYLNERVPDWDSLAHTRRRPSWDGGVDRYGVKHSSVWAKAVRAINEANANPGLWVYSHFSPLAANIQVSPKTHTLPEMRPSMLYRPHSFSTYQRYCAETAGMLEQRHIMAAETVRMRFASTKAYNLAKDDQTLYVLCDESYVSASPFFRHAFAALANCDRAVERYLWFAALEYEALQPIYDGLIQKKPEYSWWVDNDLPAAVCAIRQHWRNYCGE